MKLRKYLINALETQKRDKAKHKAYIKQLEAYLWAIMSFALIIWSIGMPLLQILRMLIIKH